METFDTHCFIEFYYGEHNRFLCEHSSILASNVIKESYGMFDGCDVIAKKIIDSIEEYDIKTYHSKFTKFNLNNKWIYSINLFLFNEPSSKFGASYLPENSKIIVCGNDKTKKYHPLTLTLNTAHSDRTQLISIMHELTHAYEDYNRRIKNKESIEDVALKNGYHLNNNLGDYKNEKKYLSWLLYYITDFEKNAYLSQLKGELQNSDTYFMRLTDIIDFLKNTKLYRDYQTVSSYIDFFSKIEDKVSQKTILVWIGEISNLEFSTYNRFVKYIKQKKFEIERKINVFLPKIASQYLNYGNYFQNSDNDLPTIYLP